MLLFKSGKNLKKKNRKRKKPSVLDTKSIHSKTSTHSRQKSTKKLTIKSKNYEHNYRKSYQKCGNQHPKK